MRLLLLAVVGLAYAAVDGVPSGCGGDRDQVERFIWIFFMFEGTVSSDETFILAYRAPSPWCVPSPKKVFVLAVSPQHINIYTCVNKFTCIHGNLFFSLGNHASIQ
jgi:hypothetical protein